MGKKDGTIWIIGGLAAVVGLGWCFLMGPCAGFLGGDSKKHHDKSPSHKVKVKKNKTPPIVPQPPPSQIDPSVPNGLGGVTPLSQVPLTQNFSKQVTLSPDALRLAGARANLSYY